MKRNLLNSLLLCSALMLNACTNRDTANHNAGANTGAANNAGASAGNTNSAANSSAGNSSTAAPTATATQTSAEAAQEIERIERDWAAAYMRGDADAVGRFIADDAVMTDPGSTVHSKADLLNALKSGDLKLEAIDISDFQTKVYGDTAVATYRVQNRGTYKGQSIAGEERWTDTFVRRGGRWECVASHGSSKPQASKPQASPKKK